MVKPVVSQASNFVMLNFQEFFFPISHVYGPGVLFEISFFRCILSAIRIKVKKLEVISTLCEKKNLNFIWHCI